MFSFMQALMRPPPGWTWLQNRAMSGLQARKTALAAGFCAMAVDADSNRIAGTKIAATAAGAFNRDMFSPS
jgi:hypothetical protein